MKKIIKQLDDVWAKIIKLLKTKNIKENEKNIYKHP